MCASPPDLTQLSSSVSYDFRDTGKLIAVKEIQIVHSGNDGVEKVCRAAFALMIVYYAIWFPLLQQLAKLEREIEMMRGLRHSHVVKYKGVRKHDRVLAIFMEYVPGELRLFSCCNYELTLASIDRWFPGILSERVWRFHGEGVGEIRQASVGGFTLPALSSVRLRHSIVQTRCSLARPSGLFIVTSKAATF